jgi:hypothetical protein
MNLIIIIKTPISICLFSVLKITKKKQCLCFEFKNKKQFIFIGNSLMRERGNRRAMFAFNTKNIISLEGSIIYIVVVLIFNELYKYTSSIISKLTWASTWNGEKKKISPARLMIYSFKKCI